MRRLSKINMQQVTRLTLVGEDYQDIYKANKINWQKGRAAKTRRTKNTQANSTQNRCLLTKIMDNKHQRPILAMPETKEWHISQMNGYLKMLLRK